MRARAKTKSTRSPAPAPKAKRFRPALVFQDGKAVSVVIDIRRYREMLELIEDLDDLAYVEKLAKKPLKSRPFEEFLNDHGLR